MIPAWKKKLVTEFVNKLMNDWIWERENEYMNRFGQKLLEKDLLKALVL